MSRGSHLAARPEVDAAVAGLFTPGAPSRSGPGHVGLELELIPVLAGSAPPRRAPIDATRSVVAEAGADLAEANLTWEPGGQLELSPACAPTAREAVATALELVARLRAAAAERGISLLSCGADPWNHPDEVGLQLDRPRYRGLQAQFDRIGPAGRRMMRCTAALQVCLDIGQGDSARERWLLLNAAGPALAAALANSPAGDGVPAGAVSTRSLAWQATDSSRTGFSGAHVDGGPAGYREFVLDAEVLPLSHAPEAPPGTSLRTWLAARADRPDDADLSHHLSTLFPPVRPRGYLEVRYLDAQPMELVPVAVALVVALVEDPTALSLALDAVAADRRPWGERWRASAVEGLNDPDLRTGAASLVELAAAGARRLPAEYLPEGSVAALEELGDRVLAGRSPADDRLEAFRVDPTGVAAWI